MNVLQFPTEIVRADTDRARKRVQPKYKYHAVSMVTSLSCTPMALCSELAHTIVPTFDEMMGYTESF